MNILIVRYNISQMGGIINHTNHLVYGLQKIGHTVELAELVWKERIQRQQRKVTLGTEGWEEGPLGTLTHQSYGWDTCTRIPYKGESGLYRWRNFANKFDVIIWTTPVPSVNRENTGNKDWAPLYELPTRIKQIAFIHDGNLQEAYPHIVMIANRFVALACVHDAAWHSAKGTGVRRALVPNPFNPTMFPSPSSLVPFSERPRGIASFQTFKGWKRVEDLIRAVPYLPKRTDVYIAGSGINYCYMTSPDKCPDKFRVEKQRDPDCNTKDIGERIWDVAARRKNFRYLGWITERERNDIMQNKVRVFVDSAWSKRYALYGGHFHRTTIEAFLNGCILVARNLGGIGGLDERGEGIFFKPGRDYIMAPYNTTPREYAKIIDDACNLPKDVVARIQKNNRAHVKRQFAESIAKRVVNLALGLKDLPDPSLPDDVLKGNNKLEQYLWVKGKSTYERVFVDGIRGKVSGDRDGMQED